MLIQQETPLEFNRRNLKECQDELAKHEANEPEDINKALGGWWAQRTHLLEQIGLYQHWVHVLEANHE